MKILICTAILAAAVMAADANAEFTGSVGSTYAEVSGADLFVANATLGYKFPVNEHISIQPEIRGGVGLNEDSVSGVDVEINNTFGFNLRLQAEISNSIYVFAQPSYTRYEVEAEGFGFEFSDKSWEFGGGGGLGFRLNQNFALEAGYERVDDLDTWRAAFRFYY